MSSKKIFALRDLSAFFYLLPLRMIATILPVRIVRSIGVLIAYIYSTLSARRRRAIEKKLMVVFKDTEKINETEKISKQCLFNAASTYINDLILHRISKKDLLKCGKIMGLENLENALSAQKGVILVSGHFCGNRVAKRFLSEIGFPILSIRKKPFSNPAMSMIKKKYLQPIRFKLFNKIVQDYVFIEDDYFSLKILKRLRENGLVDIHIDARNSSHLIECAFLGTKRLFPADFLRIVYLTNAPVIPMLCIGNCSSFTIIFEKSVEFHKTSNKDEFISVNLNKLVRILESQIVHYPSQWLPIMKRLSFIHNVKTPS
ncbi:MAG: lysophospholipid acyltransferase family protein [Nitrospirae bacterium]|nr:lysophospholipid acyltransferase family protein [Nitrospirota bacterium]